MNSLQELNGYASTSITYSDVRDAGVVFNLPDGVNQTNTVSQYESHTVPTGIEIFDVIRPDVCLPTYTIDVSSLAGTTITWDTIPSGCVVTNPSTGVYTISGVNSAAIWLVVRSPRVTLPMLYVGSFTYTCTVTYNTSVTESWDVTTTVTDLVYLSTPSDNYFEVSGAYPNTEFGGSGALISSSAFSGAGTDSNTVTIAGSFYVGSGATSAVYDIFALQLGTTADTNNRGIQLLLQNGKLRFTRADPSGSNSEVVYVNSSVNTAAWNRFVLYIKGNGSNTAADCKCWINGIDVSSNIQTGSAIGSFPLSGSINTNWSNTTVSTFRIGRKITSWGDQIGSDFVGKIGYLYIHGGDASAPDPSDFLPYYIGTDGTLGGAVQPYIFHYGDTTTAYVNNGTGFASYSLSTSGTLTNNEGDTIAAVVSGASTITSNFSTTWTANVVPSTTAAIDTMVTAGAGGTVSFNNSTKTLTIAGTKTQVNSHLSTLTFYIPSSQITDFTVNYQAVNDTLDDADALAQNWYSTYILDEVRANESYSLNTVATISNGPLIIDTGWSDSTGYTMTVVPSPTGAVSALSSTGRMGYSSLTTFSSPSVDGSTTNDFGSGLAISPGKNYLAIGDYLDNTGSAPNYDGSVFVYTGSGSSWTLQATVRPSDSNGTLGGGFGYKAIMFNTDADYMVVGAYNEDTSTSTGSDYGVVYVFTRSGSTWTQQARITNPGGNLQFGKQVYINGAGDYLGIKDVSGTVWQYNRSGSTWTGSGAGGPSTSDNPQATTGDGDLQLTVNSSTQVVTLSQYQQVGYTWNSGTKTLTLNGTRAQINADIDTIQLTPTTGYNSNFALVYTVVTPRTDTDSRSQSVNYV